MKGPRDHARELLKKAEHDLVAARATLATGEATDMVCFHAQQAAEKSLKSLLAMKDVQYPWRHDLAELLELIRAHYPYLKFPTQDIVALSPYAVAARYDEAWAPAAPEACQALAIAEQAYNLARQTVETP
ncbi:MAG: HEPN domain-containing protein [Planctomycetota bacterium]